MFLVAVVLLLFVPWHLVDTSANAMVVAAALLAGVFATFGLIQAKAPLNDDRPVAAPLIGVIAGFFILTNALYALAGQAPLPADSKALGVVFILLCVFTVIAAWLAAPRLVTYTLLGLAMVALTVLAMELPKDVIDVATFNRLGSDALVHGRNPYAPVYPDIYAGSLGSKLFYGPGVVLKNGMLAYGYPYPPVALVMQAPFALIHAYKAAWAAWPALAAVAVSSIMPRGAATYRLLPLLLAFAPFSAAMIFWTWIEPLSLALLGFTAVAGVKRHWSFPWLLGLTLVSKQYFVVCVPLLVLLLPIFREMGLRRCLGSIVAAAVLVTAPFVAVDPRAFWRAVVTLLQIQPYRPDSLSLVVLLQNRLHWFDATVLGVLPLAIGTLTALLLAWKAPRTMEGFVGGLGITLLVTVLFSKQAFGNYYALVEGCFILAGILLMRRRALGVDGVPAPPA